MFSTSSIRDLNTDELAELAKSLYTSVFEGGHNVPDERETRQKLKIALIELAARRKTVQDTLRICDVSRLPVYPFLGLR